MSAFYTNLQNTAGRLLKTYGASFSFSFSNQSAYDPAQSSATSSLPSVFQLKGIVANYKKIEIDGTSVKDTDLKLICEHGSTDLNRPAINKTVNVYGAEYQILGVKEINPAGTPMYYECQLRK